MLNKEESLQALKDFTHEVLRNHNNIKFDRKCNKHVLKSRFQRQHDLLEQLINEHFDNPPLSFDDLKEGMWVWDDEQKWYRKIVFLFVPCKQYHPKGSFKAWADSCETSLDFVVFEENRFYRRQKED